MLNTPLLRFLKERYLDSSPQTEGIHTSSHWQQCLERLRIETDPDGRLLSLHTENTGLQTFERRGRADVFLDRLCMIVHGLTLPRKAELLELVSAARPLLRSMELPFTLDALRQLYCLAEIEERIPSLANDHPPRFLIIGDGYGFLAAVIKKRFPDSRLVLADLGKTLFIQASLCQRAFPEASHVLYMDPLKPKSDFVYCPAEELNRLEDLDFDAAVSVGALHEMPAAGIRCYFDFLRRTLRRENFFYVCSREYKKMPAGDGLRFDEYPWDPGDRILADGPCAWHRFYFSRRREPAGPSLAGRRIPWINAYENPVLGFGKVRRRICVMNQKPPLPDFHNQPMDSQPHPG